MSVQKLFKVVSQAHQELESRIIGYQGRTKAKNEAKAIFDNLGLIYSEGNRDSYTVYYLSIPECSGSVSLFIEYSAGNKVISVTTY